MEIHIKTLIQNTLKFLGESVESESVESESILVEVKSKEIYDFLNQYLHTMDFDSYINNETLYNVVIRNNKEIIGARIYKLDNGKLHLNYSAVKPEFRNKGLNQKMLNVIEKLAKENNVKTLTSNVRVSNTPSIKSLEKSGFSINKNYPDLKYPDGEQKLPMFKHLN